MQKNDTMTLSFCAEEALLGEIERVREEHRKEAGFLSRSAILRLLLRRGLDTVRDRGLLDEARAGQ